MDFVEEVIIRPYEIGDENEISELIAYTMRTSNQGDYSSEKIEE